MRQMNMDICVNGESRVPPGFRFHPTEEELLQYYLRKKVANEKIDLDVIFEVDLNKLEPWDIQEKCKIGSTPQNDWYFFSHKDKKYPTGTRTNRATSAGFWKATGRDKVICSNCIRIGMRKTLVFYEGRAPHGQKSDWIMHEYRLDDTNTAHSYVTSGGMNGNGAQEEGWVVCRIFKKKNHISKGPLGSPVHTIEVHSSLFDDHDHHDDEGALEQIFQFMGTKPSVNNTPTSALQPADAHNSPTVGYQPIHVENDVVSISMLKNVSDPNSVFNSDVGLGDWAALDRFVASHLNGQPIVSSSATDHLHLPPLRSSGHKISYHPAATLDNYGGNEINLWSFTRSSLAVDPLCHVSDASV